ncbi:hypothetical protein [Spirosoma validum]|uniref:Uncharacterized protein n=1 Tax=Spirosoma validum TaxID=2771355 RepID=A0A927B8W9_9BACT|nr:hypothetical protein [Spirosoma validum]MBD2757302.1 hypothetical protein [Spirosoma validum]
MENESIKARILADYKTLLAIKYDSPLVIVDKLKLIGEHITQLGNAGPDEQANYTKAGELIESARSTEYVAFSQAQSDDEKEQRLADLKHKVAEACQLLAIHS